MEPVDQVKWDLILTGTDLAQSLLALSLSRSNKKILHLDRNRYYGGPEAALSLQDVGDWVREVQSGATPYFQHANVVVTEERKADGFKKLGLSRDYSIALAPQVIYARSALIPVLVSSKVYRQLDFMAVGSWWIYDAITEAERTTEQTRPSLRKIPSGREDIFDDKTLDLKAKRSLIKFLRLAMDADASATAIKEFGRLDLGSYLTQQFGISPRLQAGLHALTLSPQPPSKTPLSYALPRITRHISSFGVFGAGFSAVIPKWGGIAEVAQVACRALAVGGGVYMLGTGVREQRSATTEGSDHTVALELDSEDTVRTTWVAAPSGISIATGVDSSTRSITIVTSELKPLFPSLGEGAPRPAAAVVVFPAASLGVSDAVDIPVYLMVHSSETGECPPGQVIIYASVGSTTDNASRMLSHAIDQLLLGIGEDSTKCVRWMLEYQQRGLHSFPTAGDHDYVSEGRDTPPAVAQEPNIFLPPSSLDLSFDDSCLEHVRAACHAVTGIGDEFMEFDDREKGAYDSDDLDT